jgi:hypothetical protein
MVKRFVTQVLEVRQTQIFTILAIWVLVMWNQHFQATENDRPLKHGRAI